MIELVSIERSNLIRVQVLFRLPTRPVKQRRVHREARRVLPPVFLFLFLYGERRVEYSDFSFSEIGIRQLYWAVEGLAHCSRKLIIPDVIAIVHQS